MDGDPVLDNGGSWLKMCRGTTLWEVEEYSKVVVVEPACRWSHSCRSSGMVDWVILCETKCVDQSSLLVAMDGVLTW